MINLRSSTKITQLTHIAIKWCQLLAGIQEPILHQVHIPLPHLYPMKWIPSIRTFLASINATLEIEHTHSIMLQRQGDLFLIDYFLQQTSSSSILQQLNACWLYLNVTLLSEICNPNGSDISHLSYAGQQRLSNPSSIIYPWQSQPNETAWRHWRSYISQLLVPNTLTLRNPLRKWLVTGPNLTRKWQYQLTSDRQTLFVFQPNARYSVFRHHKNKTYVPLQTTTQYPSISTVPVMATPFQQTFILKSFSKYNTPAVHPTPATFSDYIKDTPPWEARLLTNVIVYKDVFQIAHQWHSITTSNPLLMATDGSAPDYSGLFGWILALPDGTRQAANYGTVQGYRISSFRAERYGLLLAMCFLRRVSVFTSVPLPPVMFLLDSKSMITRVHQLLSWTTFFPNQTLIPEYDVLQAILRYALILPHKPQFQHVKSHQDNKMPYSSLSLHAQLNVDADHLAGQVEASTPNANSHVTLIEGSGVLLHLHEGTVTTKQQHYLRYTASAPALITYMRTKYKWDITTHESIDWSAHRLSLQRYYFKRQFIVKYVHEWLPVGHLVSKYSPTHKTSCPMCNLYKDFDHFLGCKELSSIRSEMYDHIKSNSQQPMLNDVLITGIRTWIACQQFPSHQFPATVQL